MAYADGELDEPDRMRAELLVGRDVTAARFVEQVNDLGEYVRLGYESEGGGRLAGADIADAVMRLLAVENDSSLAAGSVAVAPVRSLSAERTKRMSLSRTMSQRKAIFGAAAALALAASVLVFARKRTEELPMGRLAVAASSPRAGQQAPEVAPALNSGLGVDVSTMNSSSNAVSVFYFPSANELSTSVVLWVDETGEK